MMLSMHDARCFSPLCTGVTTLTSGPCTAHIVTISHVWGSPGRRISHSALTPVACPLPSGRGSSAGRSLPGIGPPRRRRRWRVVRDRRALNGAGRNRLQESVDLCPAARFRSVRDVELAVDVRQVELDGLLGDPEHARELGVRVALGDQPEDLELPSCQVELLRDASVGPAFAQRSRAGRSSARTPAEQRPRGRPDGPS